MRLLRLPTLPGTVTTSHYWIARNNSYLPSSLVCRSIMTTSEPQEAQHTAGKETEKLNVSKSDEWKILAPYNVHGKQGNFMALYDSSCHCGRVTYQLSIEKPLDAKHCHCKTCQKLHGAPFQWAAIFHKGDISFTNGHNNFTWYESNDKTVEHKLPCKVTCSYCRTLIIDEGRNMVLIFPTLINFKSQEEQKRFDSTCHIFYGSRVVDISDGRPKWCGINEKSKLLDDGSQSSQDNKNDGNGNVPKVLPTL
ncbi:Mss4-like protein [Bisporella sp. PMI_857]|nr:Mss4-like protein [Bisporella sp. PMI_857]